MSSMKSNKKHDKSIYFSYEYQNAKCDLSRFALQGYWQYEKNAANRASFSDLARISAVYYASLRT
jgi:hypothetical protein